MNTARVRRGKLQSSDECKSCDWMLEKADAIKGFLAKQRSRSHQSNSKTAWLLAWDQLAAQGQLAKTQLLQAIQQPPSSCPDLQHQHAELVLLHEQLADETQELQLHLLGQVLDLRSLIRRAVAIRVTDSRSDMSALASLQQELLWLKQDTADSAASLAAAAQNLIFQLTAAAPGSCGASAALMDVTLPARISSANTHCTTAANAVDMASADTGLHTAGETAPSRALPADNDSLCIAAESMETGEGSCALSQAAPQLSPQCNTAEGNAAPAACLKEGVELPGNHALLPSHEESAAPYCISAASDDLIGGGGSSAMCASQVHQHVTAEMAETPHSFEAASRCSGGSEDPMSDLVTDVMSDSVTDTLPISAMPGCKVDADLRHMLCQQPFACRSIQQQLLETLSSLHQHHQQLLSECWQMLHTHRMCCVGWSADEHALFVWLRSQAVAASTNSRLPGHPALCSTSSRSRGASTRLPSSCAATGSRSRAAVSKVATAGVVNLVEYVAMRMPSKSRQQLQEHEAWYTTALQLQRHVEEQQQGWQRQKAAFLQTAAARLSDSNTDALAAAEAAAARLSTAVNRQLLHDQRQGMQVIRQQQQEQAAAATEAESVRQAAQAAADAAAFQEYCMRQKELVQAYKEEASLRQQQAAAEAAQRQQADIREAAAAVAASKPAVAARQEGAFQRLQQQHQQVRQQALDADARQQRLAAIAAALSPQVPRDPTRVLQGTASSLAQEPLFGRAFKPVHGFTAERVTADPCFRLIEALRGAGALTGHTHTVNYVKQAMARLQQP